MAVKTNSKKGTNKSSSAKTKKTTTKTAAKTGVKKKSTSKTAAKKKSTTQTKKKTTKKASGKKTTKKKKSSRKSTKGLIIVESPAKARTLERFSKGKFNVKASMGHIRDLPKTRIGVDVENDYQPKYLTIRGKKDIVNDLKKSAKKASKVMLAPDPDREGEAIAWHLAQILDVDDLKRIEMHEITQSGFNNALDNPRQIDGDRVNAQQARRILDRLVGYNLSPLLWRKIQGGLSAGRVQSVTVKMICDRQREIDNFVPEEYWSLDVLASKLKDPVKQAFEASLAKHKNKKIKIPDKETSDKILAELKKEDYIVDTIKKRDQKKNPPPPHKTSTLQQEAYGKLGFAAKKTMRIAQQLYEGIDAGPDGHVGLITYMRTDSARISNVAAKEAEEFVVERFGKDYISGGRKYKSAKSAQEAHEAIRPTSSFRDPQKMKSYLKRDQLRLYTLIWNRFIASQMAAAIHETTSVEIKAGDYLFRASDSKVKFPGYLAIYGVKAGDRGGKSGKSKKSKNEKEDKDSKDKSPLPKLEEGEKLKIHEYLPKQHFTQPPPNYTEASLIKALEERGIGRPSTYAPIVDTIQKRGYVEKLEKKFFPTELGYTVTDMLAEHFPNILDVEFTADMEEKLDKIEEGQADWVNVIDKFYRPFSKTLEEADAKIPKVEIAPEPAGFNCEKCGSPMVIKRGRFGKFIACSGYPECKNTKPLLIEIGVLCPNEGCDGQIVERKSRKGKFYGCSNYPNCKYASWDKPINEKCPACGNLMVLKFSRNGRSYKTCSNSECATKSRKKAKK